MRRALVITVLTLVAAPLLPAGEVRAHPAWGIAVDREGRVYFSDLVRVWKLDPGGVASIFRAGGHHTHELNVDDDGNLYGAENSYDPATGRFFGAVWKMTPAGDFSYLLPLTDDLPEGAGIWRDGGGNTYHATNHPGRELLVLKRSPDGTVTALAGSREALPEYRQGVPYGAGGMAFGGDGSLYFTHGANVSRLAKDGTLTALARDLSLEDAGREGAGGASQTRLFGVAVDARGDVYVADQGNRRVLRLTPDGRVNTPLRVEEPWFPTGVAAGGGDLFILEHEQTPTNAPAGTRVRKLSPDGGVTVLATVGGGGAETGSGEPKEAPAAVGSERTPAPGRPVGSALSASNAPAVAGACVVCLGLVLWLARRRARRRRGGGSP